MKRTLFCCLLIAVVAIFSCGKQEPTAPAGSQPEVVVTAGHSGSDGSEPTVSAIFDAINAGLAGTGYMAAYAEYITSGEGDQMGATLIQKDVGNKQLSHHFVSGDPRRTWSSAGTSINWIVDLAEGAATNGGGGLTAAQTDAAIGSAMATWQDVNCSDIPLVDDGSFNFDFGYVQALLGFGGVLGIGADLTHAGFLPGAFFDAIAPGGSGFILGVTFTFIFTDGVNPTDIDNNGKNDTAFREIYYNDAFPWNTNGGNFDVETVALHEAGHGLSQAHFGNIFIKHGSLSASPRAVMNAIYGGVLRNLKGNDNGGHCSIWASWPN